MTSINSKIVKTFKDFVKSHSYLRDMLFINEETNEKIFQIIYSNSMEELNDYINKMKIYNPTKLELIRLTIKGNCQDTESLNLIDTTHENAIKYVIKEFSEYMVKKPSFKTTIDLRHCIGGDNLSSQEFLYME